MECSFTDVYGRCWQIIEKEPVISTVSLDIPCHYPQPGVVACEILSSRVDDLDRPIVEIDTKRPWGVEAIDGTTRFVVFAYQLIKEDDAI